MRLIDADKLLENSFKNPISYNAFCNLVKRQMTVDAVPVVRCQDCKWYQPDADKWCGYFECMGFEPDNYCSQGERKDGNNHE